MKNICNRCVLRWLRRVRILSGIALVSVSFGISISQWAVSSDHADPIDLMRKEPLEPVITDLFVFPVDKQGMVVTPYRVTDGIPLHPKQPSGSYVKTGIDKSAGEFPMGGLPKSENSYEGSSVAMRSELSPEDRQKISALMVIFCVRRALTPSQSLDLEPYTYRIHFDTKSSVTFNETAPRPPQGGTSEAGYATSTAAQGGLPTVNEARLRYGGMIDRPDKIAADIQLEFRLTNKVGVHEFKATGLKGSDWAQGDTFSPDKIHVFSDVRDDPFIFPAFFGTNVVAIVTSIPMSYLPEDLNTLLIWGTSHKGNQQIDHVGRSLRTQNPRFDLLNTRHPSEHVAAIIEEEKNPSFMRDIFLRIGLQQVFAYRKWDKVPDVMIYGLNYPVGYPNGRLLTDDVAALLAQHGDTALLELSHLNGDWPRQTKNDKEFSKTFPYLAEPHPDNKVAMPHQLSARNKAILWAIGILAGVIVVLAAFQVVYLVKKWLGIRPRPKPL